MRHLLVSAARPRSILPLVAPDGRGLGSGARSDTMAAMDVAVAILAIATTVIAVSAIAERIGAPAPLLLVVVGIGASVVPFLDAPELGPDLVLFGLLPPLLYAAAIRTSVIDFRVNRRSIAYLSVALVVVTALGVGAVTWWLLDIPFGLAFAFGAVVAPPDAVAATSIARRVGMPRRIVTVLEGESLVNDATAITCVRVGLLALTGPLTVLNVTAAFLVAAVGGAVVGFVVALLALQVRRRLTAPVFDTAVSLLVPFAAYLPAEAIHLFGAHGSGVIAVVVAGLVLGTKSPTFQSGQSRLSERVNWATVQFLLENTVFLLIGLQASRIVQDVSAATVPVAAIVVFCLAVLLAVIVLRLGWVAIGGFFLFRRDRDYAHRPPPWSNLLVTGWAGLRGVVTLAAVFLIPADAPHRETMVLAAMVVVAGTLLLQGGSLPWLVRRLGLRGPDPRSDALQAATVLESATRAGLARLDQVAGPEVSPDTVATLRQRLLSKPHAVWEKLGASDSETPAEEYRRLRLATLQAEREEVLRIRRGGGTESDVIESVLSALDIEESMLTIAGERSERLSEVPVATPQHPDGPCDHLTGAPPEIAPTKGTVCQDCVREHTQPVHLRICLTCANVGCCDSSPGLHAKRHFRETGHPVMRSFEPGEGWRWCYLDERIG
jgi:CPA1 family monovalent cation:H+ antiporter